MESYNKCTMHAQVQFVYMAKVITITMVSYLANSYTIQPGRIFRGVED